MNRSSTVGMPSFRTPAVRLGDFHPPHRLRLVGPVQKVFSDGWPVLGQVAREVVDGHSIDTRTALVGLHAPQCFLQVVSLTHLLHQSVGSSGAFGSTGRPGRFSLSPVSLSSFTRQLDREVQSCLDMPLRVVRETHGLLTTPSRSGLQSPFPARPICCSAFRHWSASRALPTPGPTMPSADFCVAVRPPLDGLSHRGDTTQISWGKCSRLPCTVAGSTRRTLDGYGLRGKSPARPARAPSIRFLSIDSHVCSMLLSDPASRRWPLHHH